MAEVKLTHDNHRRTYRVVFKEGEVPDRAMPYSRIGQTYAPLSAEVVMWRSHDEPWSVSSVELYGRAHKKDGTVGLKEATERFYSSDRERQPQLLTDALAAILSELNKS